MYKIINNMPGDVDKFKRKKMVIIFYQDSF